MSTTAKAPLVPAVAYYRMSSDKQEASIPAQRSEVQAYAAKYGYRIVREYLDEGISGDATEKRFQFQKMLKDAKELGDFVVILCWDQDRFGRFDPLEAGYWIKPLRDVGVRLETVAQGKIDWEDFSGRLLYVVQQEGKHAYLRDLSRNVVRGMRKSAAEGKRQGGKPPYGYKVVRQRLVRGEPQEVEVVKWLFNTYAWTDTSLRALVKDLNSRGIPGPRGGLWHPSPTRLILTCPHYLGTLAWGRDTKGKYVHAAPRGKDRAARIHQASEAWLIVPGGHEALVDRDTWERVQSKLNERRTHTSPCTGGGKFLLTGLVFCAHCGRLMHGQTPRNPRTRAACGLQYLCSGYQRYGRAVCNHHIIKEQPLVSLLVKKIQEGFLSAGNLRLLKEELARQVATGRRNGRDEEKRIRARVAELERQIDQGSERLALLPPDLIEGVAAKVRAWKAEQEQLQGKLAGFDRETASAREAAELAERALARLWTLQERIGEADPARLREVLGEIVAKVECWFDQGDTGKRYRYRLSRGLIHLRPDIQISSLVPPGQPCSTASRTAATVPE
jgi:DNA invertase Pin-like site-specific DNA recombinase